MTIGKQLVAVGLIFGVSWLVFRWQATSKKPPEVEQTRTATTGKPAEVEKPFNLMDTIYGPKVSVAELRANPAEYIGQSIRLTGRVTATAAVPGYWVVELDGFACGFRSDPGCKLGQRVAVHGKPARSRGNLVLDCLDNRGNYWTE